MTTQRHRRVSITVRSWDRGVDHVHHSVRFAGPRVLLAMGLAIVAATWMLSPFLRSRPEAVASATGVAPVAAAAPSGAACDAHAMPGMDMPIAEGSCSHSSAASGAVPGGYVPADPQVTAVPSQATPPPTGFHEFEAKCSPVRRLADDPIVHPGHPGGSHMSTAPTADCVRSSRHQAAACGWQPRMAATRTAFLTTAPTGSST